MRKILIFGSIYLFMKFLLTILIIVGILSGAASLLVMDHHGNCIASSVAGVSCPAALNPLVFFGIHLNFLKNFSEGLLMASFAMLLLAFFYAPDFIKPGNADRIVGFFSAASFDLNNTPLKRKLIFWLSLLENSPAIS